MGLSERDRRLGMRPMPGWCGRKRRAEKRKRQREQQKQEKQNRPWIPYREYLLTKWWRCKRNTKLKSTDYRCERCGEEATQVHHKHYQTMWREKNSDLESLCETCHQCEHECLVQCDRHLRSIAAGNY